MFKSYLKTMSKWQHNIAGKYSLYLIHQLVVTRGTVYHSAFRINSFQMQMYVGLVSFFKKNTILKGWNNSTTDWTCVMCSQSWFDSWNSISPAKNLQEWSLTTEQGISPEHCQVWSPNKNKNKMPFTKYKRLCNELVILLVSKSLGFYYQYEQQQVRDMQRETSGVVKLFSKNCLLSR